jgi:Family of unknown function (DUF6326)
MTQKWTDLPINVKLSTLGITASLSYLFCDVISLMDPELLKQYLQETVTSMAFTPGFLLGAAILISIPILMVLLSRVLNYRANRWANITAATFMTGVQTLTLFIGWPASYYPYPSIIEITCTVLIVGYAWKWREPTVRPAVQPRVASAEAPVA